MGEVEESALARGRLQHAGDLRRWQGVQPSHVHRAQFVALVSVVGGGGAVGVLDDACFRVDEQAHGAVVLEHGLEHGLALLARGLGRLAFGNVLERADEEAHGPVLPAYEADVELGPDVIIRLGHKAQLQAVALAAAGQRLVGHAGVFLPSLRVEDLLPAQGQELLGRVAEQIEHGGVDVEEAVVRAAHGDGQAGVQEYGAIVRLARAQFLGHGRG